MTSGVADSVNSDKFVIAKYRKQEWGGAGAGPAPAVLTVLPDWPVSAAGASALENDLSSRIGELNNAPLFDAMLLICPVPFIHNNKYASRRPPPGAFCARVT